jgi:glucose/arabinose dehydrogenase
MRKNILLPVQTFLLSITLFFTAGKFTYAQPVIAFNGFLSGFSSPIDITNARDGSNRLFIVEQSGRIRIYNGTMVLPTAFLNISSIITFGGEQGLLSLAFHPNYNINRYFFVYYTNLSGDITIARYQTQAGNANLADAASGVVLLTIPKPFTNHNGGDLNFGPDGYLYFGTGDGGSGGDPNNFAQNGLSLLGKMIRIDVNNFLVSPYYTIPADNPYVGDPNVDDHIWVIGLRNPWRWSFDRANNNMWIADVGQGAREEVNFRTAGNTGGINYGWRCYEGNNSFNLTGCSPPANYIFPIFDYPHNSATGGFSITGGFVYRGPEYPVLQGYYICADYVSGNVWLINPNGAGGWNIRMQSGMPGSISSFGESENGTLYAVSLGGNIYKVDVTTVLPLSLLSFSGTKQTGFNELKWTVAASQDINRFIIEYSSNGSAWNVAGEVTALNQPGNQQYSFRHYTSETGKLFYRLQIEENNGTSRYSPVISINGKEDAVIKVFPTLLTGHLLQVVAEKEVTGIKIMDSNGRVVLAKQMNGQQGFFTVSLPELSRGLYWVRVETRSGNETVKIVIE